MADELIDILNDDITVKKTCLKSEAHKHGHLHASVHVWFYTKSGEILFQKRSTNKIAFPNLWDVSVAGHISSGETAIKSALREVKEEIGLSVTINELKKIGSFKEFHQHKIDFIDNEIHLIYIGELSTPLNQLKIQEEELSAIKLIPIDTFKKELEKSDFYKSYVPHSNEYYTFVLNEISKNL
ncbi:MAG: NUDIX domain-containing protein [Urechidicola sp.]|nr:NUDIX domain-containing protein [Urechidicola sp.]